MQELIKTCVEQAAEAAFEPTGVSREAYLDRAEEIVRRAAAWQQADGRVVDPWQGVEVTWATGRFVGALGGLIGAGRCLDLGAHLDAGVRRLAHFYRWQIDGSGPRLAVEFFSKELGWAFWQAGKHLSDETVQSVRETLADADPDAVYVDTLAHHSPEQIFNFNTFSLAGEQLLRAAGLRGGGDYVERHLPPHRPHFTELGLYCDPDAAVVYDWVPRVNLSTLLWAGYDGVLAEEIGARLAQGALTQLLLHNPQGLGWFGGRSNQYQFNEMQLAVICEYEAQRRAGENPTLAGMFRRAARLGLRAIEPWLRMSPPRHLKNAFHPAVAWGFDSYGGYSVYLLLAASLMTFAYHFSEAEIEEAPLPAEVQSYAVDLGPRFHQAFAHRRGLSVQWDLKANLHYDATGLGRVLWPEGGLLSPLPPLPSYGLPSWLRPAGQEVRSGEQNLSAASIACAWQRAGEEEWRRLAEAQPESCDFAWSAEEDALSVRITWRLDGEPVQGGFELRDGELRVHWEVVGASAVRCEWPLMVTDGEGQSVLRAEGCALLFTWGDQTVRVEGSADAEARLADGVLANRHGLYRLGLIEAAGERVECVAKWENIA